MKKKWKKKQTKKKYFNKKKKISIVLIWTRFGLQPRLNPQFQQSQPIKLLINSLYTILTPSTNFV